MKQRIITALVLAPIVLAALFLSNPIPLLALAFVITVLAFEEIRSLIKAARTLPLLTLAGLALPTYAYVRHMRDPHDLVIWNSGLFLLGISIAFFAAKRGRGSAAEADLAGLWASIPMASLFFLHELSNTSGIFHANNFALMAILPLWGGDIAGMLVGKRFGKRKLAPKLSPGKTVEGGIANLATASLVALGLGTVLGLPPLASVACGLVAGIGGQAGDLFESYVKRQAGVKDSGNLLPGHGGVMDRIDSILFSAPLITPILYFWPR